MALLACIYGIIKKKSIWYAINLLASAASAQSFHFDEAMLSKFHLTSFLLACVIHLLMSFLVGLLYGAMLPMFPRRPILLGGVIAPIFWTGLLHSILGIINPLLDARIDWPWFIASQFAFGIIAGLVVAQQERLRAHQFEPFLVRAGIEAAGLNDQKPDRNESR
jgi:MFS family permease